jgi:hypothetical protein
VKTKKRKKKETRAVMRKKTLARQNFDGDEAERVGATIFFFFLVRALFFSPTRQSANDDKYDDNDDKDDANNNNDNNATIMKPRKPNTNTKEHKQCGTWSPLALEFARNRRKHAKRPF